jgi:hypothetical protein
MRQSNTRTDIMEKTYSLSKEELAHFTHLDYARGFIELTLNTFIAALIEERLGYKPDPMKEIDWKLEDGKLVLTVNERDTLYKPADSE